MPRTRTTYSGLLICVSLLSLPCAAGEPAQLVINEVMTNPLPGTNPESGFYDSFDGVTRFVDSDWVEIYNPGPGEVPLEGLCLSDNCNYIEKYQVNAEEAAILAPDGLLPEGGFALIWCPGYFRGDYDCVTEPDGECDYPIPVEMAPFRLAAEREWIGLYAPDGTLIDGFETPPLPDGRTYGCVPDGARQTRSYLEASSIKRSNSPAVNVPPLIDVRSYRGVHAAGDPPEERFSLLVEPGDEVRVRVDVIDLDDPDPYDDDNHIADVWLEWRLTAPGSLLHDVQMALADPFEPASARYEARIPGQAMASVVAFRVRALDKAGAWSEAYWSDYHNPDADPKVWFQYPVGGRGASQVTLLINEVLAGNQNVPVGGGGDPASTSEIGGYDCGAEGCIDGRRQADEWVELYNFGTAGVDLASCKLYLTDNELDPTRFRLADAVGHHPNVAAGVLPAATPMLVWCDGEPWQNDTVGVHADMTLDGDEDEVLLVAYEDADADGDPELFVILDLVVWGESEVDRGKCFDSQDKDWSLGRFPDGGAQWGRMDPTCGASPHPGAPNTGFTPAVKVLGHEPVMATPDDVVTVTARVWDDVPLPRLPAPDPSAEGWCGVKIDFGDFVSLTATKMMRDDGLEGDAVAGDSIYTATLIDALGNKPAGKVRYAVTAVDENGNKTRLPRHGAQYTLFFVAPKPDNSLVITEVMAGNRQCRCPSEEPLGCERGGRDNFGEADDWVEIYNPTAAAIYLGDYSLSDRLDWLTRWVFPAVTLGAGERLVVWCDDELDEMVTGAPFSVHSSFQLDAGGDEVYLVARAATDRQIVDYVKFGNQRSDVSSGRPEGGGDFGVLLEATPGEPNAPLAAHVEAIAENQPFSPGMTITLQGRALDRAVKVFLVDPLVMEGDEVDKWNWQEAAEMPFQRVDADLRAALPPQLANGPHRLCVLSEYDPLLHARGAWKEGGIAWTSLLLESNDAVGRFLRGDVDADGKRDIADPIALLGHLFANAAAPSCPDAADGNDDGKLDIADAIRLLGYLFGTAGDLPPPSPSCGHDPTADILGLCRYPPCE